MNKAITDGVVFMPPAFANGLDVWSSQDGTAGQDTYDGALNAALVPADQDFGGCLELQKTEVTQKLRYMGETPLLPGCYLRITARVKAVSGNLPSVRIAAWAGGAGDVHVAGLSEVGASTTLSQYGEVVEVSAIVGAGARGGVDMVWGAAPLYGHFGLDLTGPSGGVVRIDDLVIEDITSAFLRDMMPWVDVRDYGALGDGATDDLAAFEAADADADGRIVLVPEGEHFLSDSMTFESRVTFQGTVSMPDTAIFSMTQNFDLPAYIEAFGDEVLAFEKAFQSLLNGSGHESLDMGGAGSSLRGR
ncbi:glycosyl hydrolase family 28-related protein [Phycobium rhodophyticola]